MTDVTGLFLYSNRGWDPAVPAFLIDEATLILTGVNERNFDRKPVSLWVRETQKGVARETNELPWVFLSGP